MKSRNDYIFIETDAEHPGFQALCKELENELRERDGEQADAAAALNAIDSLTVVVLVLDDENPIACGGFRPYESETVELKRMYVKPAYRRQQLASQVLTELEQLAKAYQYKYCILETGSNQPEAMALYEKKGYKAIPSFGRYTGNANSRCYKKRI